uniref:S5-RNase n=1 Tax=Antirrhinum hispanicum TaxID=49039 RepID=Q38718_ANTHI|nr:S5-RNase [Antirrhinum hispanicum]
MVAKKSHDHGQFSFLVLFVILLSSYCFTANAKYFEILKLVLQWPNSYCSLKTSTCRRNPLPLKFTIHGLWPDNYSWPLSDCGYDFTLPDITDKSLLKRLDRNWPDLTKRKNIRKPDKTFWLTQWEKHGTCALSVYTFDDYFRETLNMKRRFNILDMLQRKSMRPGDRVDPQEVARAISKVTNHEPEVKCREGFLTEIIICFDTGRDASVIDCPGPLCTDPMVDFPRSVVRTIR